MGKIKEYTNNEVTVVWEAEKCIHSAICVKNLPNVFLPNDKPWIKIDAASLLHIPIICETRNS